MRRLSLCTSGTGGTGGRVDTDCCDFADVGAPQSMAQKSVGLYRWCRKVARGRRGGGARSSEGRVVGSDGASGALADTDAWGTGVRFAIIVTRVVGEEAFRFRGT